MVVHDSPANADDVGPSPPSKRVKIEEQPSDVTMYGSVEYNFHCD